MGLISRSLLRKVSSEGVGRTRSLNVWARGPDKGGVSELTHLDGDVVGDERIS
jgi:hypothetical protein